MVNKRFLNGRHAFLALAAVAVASFTIALRAQQAGNGSAAAEVEKLPPGAKLVKIEVRPDKVELKTRFDYRQLLLTGVLDNGETLDVTRMAKLEQPAAAVSVSPTGLVRPVADGNGTLKFSVQGVSTSIPVSVQGAKAPLKVSFVKDVMPVMSKVGCNAGTCHGSAKGKNGFQLSLRGYDPVFDHQSLTDDVMGRRFDKSAPDRSLMLLKPTGEVPHVGGVLFKPGEPYYDVVNSWITDGVQFDKESPRVKSIEIYPQDAVIPLEKMKQQMVVIATYTDGSTRDVTQEAFVESSNPEVAKVDKHGLVRAERRGEAAMLARYEGSYAAAPLIVMGDRTGFAWQPTDEYNWIDGLVYEKLKKVKVQAGEVCTDADFLRRVYLDLTGLPPTSEQVKAFLKDPAPSRQKRDAMIDKLIGNPDYVEHWTSKWADLLQVNTKFLGGQGAQKYRDFIKDAIAKNLPYDQFCNEILTASGSNIEKPAAAYWKILRQPQEAMENTTHLFLAVRFNCNKCHDHPFERWTQTQYYELAAYFAQVDRKEDPKFKGQKIGGTDVSQPKPLVEIVSDKNAGEVVNEKTGEQAKPHFPYTHGGMPGDTKSRREALAKWITSKDNPYFAKSYVNRVWSYLLGVGIIEPVDDIRAGNPPSNPKLLARLTDEFIKSNFNAAELIRTICKSRTYQHSIKTSKWNKDDKLNYSHAYARRLPAEVLFDSIHAVMGIKANLPGMPPGSRASQIIDANIQIPGGFLKLLGQPPRESSCECERANGMMLGPVLNLINGPVIGNAVADPGNIITKLVAQNKDDAKVVEELYIAILNRPPTPQEIAKMTPAIAKGAQEHGTMMTLYKKRKADLDKYEQELDAKQAAWEEKLKNTAKWDSLAPVEVKSQAGTEFDTLPDHAILAKGKNPSPEVYTVTLQTDVKDITGIRLEVLTDSSLPAKGPGRAPNGNFVLNEFKLSVVPVNDPQAKPKAIKLKNAIADFSQAGFEVPKAIDNNPGTGWAVSPEFGKPHTAVFEVGEKVGFEGGVKLIITMDQRYEGKLHNIGKFRISVTTAPTPLKLQLVPDHIAKVLATPADKRTPNDLTAIKNYYRSLDTTLPQLQQAVAQIYVPSDPRVVGAQDLAWALLNSNAFLFNH